MTQRLYVIYTNCGKPYTVKAKSLTRAVDLVREKIGKIHTAEGRLRPWEIVKIRFVGLERDILEEPKPAPPTATEIEAAGKVEVPW